MGRRALGVVFVFGLLAIALFPRASSGSHVAPISVGYNASCDDLSPSGTMWHEMEIDPVEDGTYSQGRLAVSINVTSENDTVTIGWSSNIAIDAVFVKGGPGGNFYHYSSPQDSDTELLPPLNPNNGKRFNPSHLLICTTTSLDTPTATAPPPATATPPATETVPPTATQSPAATGTIAATSTLSASVTPTPPGATGTPGPSPTPSATTMPGATMTPNPTATAPPRAIRTIYFPVICIGCFSAPEEPNDSCANAYPLLPNKAHDFFADDDHDWYRFELSGPAEVIVRLTDFAPQSGQLAAYHGANCESAVFLKNNGDTSPEKILLLEQQPAGVYFLYVSNDGDDNSTDPYRLFVETR